MQKALDRLGKGREEVQVQVLREASAGLLGFRAHDAIVRVTELVPVAVPEPEPDVQPDVAEVEAEAARPVEPEPVPEPVVAAAAQVIAEKPRAPELRDEDDVAYTPGTAGSDELLELSREVLLEILAHMRIIADVQAHWVPPESDEKEGALILDIVGDDLGVLIGRHGETLRDLQYILRLIVGRKIGGWANLVVDVEGYKQRRERSLRQLARQMADRVAMSRRPAFMEPMSAYERRIVHLELREHPQVTTQSSGEGERRKVGIYPR